MLGIKKVSIIIPVYNGEKTLRQCLSSVLNQSYKDYEVIVIDNNSTDKTKNMIKEFGNKNKKIKYVFEHKKGTGAARNAGINSAKGEIIVMTDSDCVVPENWIENIIKPIIYEKENAVVGFERDLIKNYWTKNIQKANWNFVKQNLNKNYINQVDTKNFAIKSSLIKKFMFDSNLPALVDFDLALRLRKITKIRFIPSVRVGHNHKSSFIKTIKLNFNRACLVARIEKKYRGKINLQNEIMTKGISFKNFILFPFWMILQFMKKPLGESFFILVSETSWRTGILQAKIKEFYNKIFCKEIYQ